MSDTAGAVGLINLPAAPPTAPPAPDVTAAADVVADSRPAAIAAGTAAGFSAAIWPPDAITWAEIPAAPTATMCGDGDTAIGAELMAGITVLRPRAGPPPNCAAPPALGAPPTPLFRGPPTTPTLANVVPATALLLVVAIAVGGRKLSAAMVTARDPTGKSVAACGGGGREPPKLLGARTAVTPPPLVT